jgi:hypothetical protein
MRPKLLGAMLLAGLCMTWAAAFPINSSAGRQAKTEGINGKQVITGTAVGMGGDLGHVSMPFTLEITGLTSKEQADQFEQVLSSKGQGELLKAMSKSKLGTFAFEGQLGHDINFVQERRTESGISITVLFERWLHMFELRYGTRSEDYPFTYVEMVINNKGKGEGSMVTAAKITLDKSKESLADLESFGAYPARLIGVELHK